MRQGNAASGRHGAVGTLLVARAAVHSDRHATAPHHQTGGRPGLASPSFAGSCIGTAAAAAPTHGRLLAKPIRQGDVEPVLQAIWSRAS
jgi:hypothetical protein